MKYKNMKITTFFICLFLAGSLYSQKHGFEADLNVSAIQQSGQLSYRYFFKNWSFCGHLGYGRFGKKSGDTPYGDGYQGIFSPFDLSGNFIDRGFEHNFIGFKPGIAFGRKVVLNEKNNLIIEVNLNYFILKDNFLFFYSSNNTGGETQEVLTVVKHQTVSLGLGLNYYYSIGKKSAIKVGLNLPYIVPSINDDLYFPKTNNFTMAGIEPFLCIGYQFKF